MIEFLSASMSAAWRRVRSAFVRLLLLFAAEDPGGAVAPNTQTFIDDGVDYSMPLVVPEWATPEQKAAIVKTYIAEAESTFHFQFDRPYRYSENLSQFPTADPLREWDFVTRKAVLARCHMAWERNPLANAAIALTTYFSVGDGLTVTYRNEQVEKILEEFRLNPENAVQQYEKSFCNDLQLDGELFIRFFKNDEQVVIVPLPPWEIDWIRTERGFRKRARGYHQLGGQTDGTPGDFENIDDEIPAANVLHIAINQCSYETRGRPELFRILPWLRAYKDWLEGRARQNHWRGALLWWVKLIGGTPSQVVTKRAQYKQPPPPGSLIVSNDKEEWSEVSNKISAADVAEDGRQIKMMTAIGAQMPEYMLSDGANANLASATAQQLPALRKFSHFQDIMLWQVWQPIYQRVLETAIEAGLLPAEVEEQDAEGEPVLDADSAPKRIPAIEAFDLAAPELEEEDPKTLAEALKIAVGYGWASNETSSGRMGFDWQIEQKKIRREEQADLERQAAGGLGSAPPNGLRLPGLAEYPPNGNNGAQEMEQEVERESHRQAQAADGARMSALSDSLAAVQKAMTVLQEQEIIARAQLALPEPTPQKLDLTLPIHLNVSLPQPGIEIKPQITTPAPDTQPIADAIERAVRDIPAPVIPPLDVTPIADALKEQPAIEVTAKVEMPVGVKTTSVVQQDRMGHPVVIEQVTRYTPEDTEEE